MQQEPSRPRLDAHLHLQTIPWNSCFADLPGREVIKSFLGKGSRSICNGTSPLDWNLVDDLVKLYPEEVIPFYGVHPWYVDALPENWLDNLYSLLIKYGAGLGEIGLDRASSSKASYDHQQDVFAAQLDLAVSLGLPVAIHCVRAWGSLLEILQDKIVLDTGKGTGSKIPIMVHSFSGSMETMRHLTGMGVFISFSPFLLSDRGESLRGVLKATPIEKVLIESDFSYNKGIPINIQITNYNKKLVNLYYTAAKIKNMDSNQFQKVVYANGKVFTDRALNRQ